MQRGAFYGIVVEQDETSYPAGVGVTVGATEAAVAVAPPPGA